MSGADKGLQLYEGQPLVAHALQRLAPQVVQVMISANRNLDEYHRYSRLVIKDESLSSAGSTGAQAQAAYDGPLAGVLAGLKHCATPYLATVPCDAPHFPLDLVQRLAAALRDSDIDLAYAACGARPHPVFALLRVAALTAALEQHLRSGGRKVQAWADAQRSVAVNFDSAEAFVNLNTLQDLQAAGAPARR